MNGKIVKIDETNRKKYRYQYLTIKLREQDIKEIECFQVGDCDGIVLNNIYDTTEELYLYIDEKDIVQLVFGMKIDNNIGRPFILQNNKFSIKENKKDVFMITRYFIEKEFKPLVDKMEVFKPTKTFTEEEDRFLTRLGFKVEKEETYKLGVNYFIKYKQ